MRMSSFVRVTAFAAFAFLAVLWLNPSAAKATIFPAYGGRGDVAEEYRCPARKVLVGFVGRTGAWIDQVSLICDAVDHPSYAVGLGPRDVLFGKGGSGGGPNEQYCPNDSAIRRIEFLTLNRNNSDFTPEYVRTIRFFCNHPRNGAFAGEATFGGNSLSSDLIIQSHAQACPGNEYAVGLNIRYGRHVNAVGLICGII